MSYGTDARIVSPGTISRKGWVATTTTMRGVVNEC